MMGRRVRHELKIVGSVLVVGSDVESHHPLEEKFRRRVEGEEGIPVDVEELAIRRMRTSLDVLRNDGRVEAENGVEPFLDLVSGAVTDGFLEFDLSEGSAESGGRFDGCWRVFRGGGGRRSKVVGRVGIFGEGGGSRGFSELLDEFDGKRSTGSFVSVDGRGHEDEVGTD